MGLFPLQLCLAQKLDDVVVPTGFRRRGQVWQRGGTTLRLRVLQATSVRDGLVRFQLETDAPPGSDILSEPVWFLMLDEERSACVGHQRQLLQRVMHTADEDEVAAVAATLREMTTDDAFFAQWLVLASDDDATTWSRLLKPPLDRVLGG
jgi:hypothetical protein